MNFYSISAGVLDSLKTPTLDVSALARLVTAKAFVFDHAYRSYSGENDSLFVVVSTDGGVTWPATIFGDGYPNLGTLPPSTTEFTPSAASDWRHHLIRIPDSLLTTSTRIAFVGKSAFGNDCWVDNVAVSVIPDTDYAVTAIAQINGIPTPFRPAVHVDKSTKGVERIVTGQQSFVRASTVNNSIMLDQPVQSKDRKVRSYLAGNAFAESDNALSINAQQPVVMNGVVTNFGISSPGYSFTWTFDGVGQTPISRPGIPFLGTDTVGLNITPTRRGTLTAIADAVVPGDQNLGNNSLTTYRVLSYPDTPMVRIKYDNGQNTPNTFIGFGSGTQSIIAGVRFHTDQNLKLANIDAFYRNEANTDSITVRIRAAGTDTSAPGIVLYTKKFAGQNYISAGGDYFTLPLGNDAPAFAAGSDFWVTIGFPAPITFPMGAHNSPLTTPGHSYYSADETAWAPLIITTERAWLLRTVGIPATPAGPVASNFARSTRVPNAGDTVAVTATITDSTGVTSASLLYAINGGTPASVTMTRVSGTPQSGSYSAVIPGTANTDGARIEYQVQATSASGLTSTSAVTANNSYFAGLSPISLSGVKAIAPNGQNLYVNYYARVTGTVNGPNFQAGNGNLSYYFQDAVGGINLFFFASPVPVLSLGDSITVIGKIAQFRGTTEITPDNATNDIAIVANGRTVTPIGLTLAQLNANPELYESRLIRLTSLRRVRATPPWPPTGSNASIIMYQNVLADSIIMFLDLDTQIPGSPEPSYPVTVTGVTGQFSSSTTIYNNGYEIIPRYLTDFVQPPPGLSGTYNVGTGGNYTTLSAAVSALATDGVAGPVIFQFTDASYTDTAQIITAYTGQGPTNPVTFKPANGVDSKNLDLGRIADLCRVWDPHG